ncbi:hypothetical protein RM572_21835 [Streptomyces sp. DSM 42041]|uniref:Uncharacterized protein n=1 Tax=Streptomyces hazeniae TaxID=3075538 RepID=A0ABU2NWP0_9ACTN|nr:hypothetical protein [Streptomyces sp. DSM 42041]MDT0381403.1 hypothetical protein [Streptomyces sp. DSM 42041]
MPHNRRTAVEDLTFITDHWPQLRALIDTNTPAGDAPTTKAAYLAALDQADAAETAIALSHVQQLTTRHDQHGRVYYECGLCDYVGEGRAHPVRPDRGPGRLAETPAPVRLHVVDACRAIEAALAHLADEIAACVQRPTMSGPDPHWPAPDRKRRRALVAEDADDPRRWRYLLGDRTAPTAAAWLLARLENHDGPFLRRLSMEQRVRVGLVAGEAAARMERTIGALSSAVPMDRPCPYCSGTLTMHRDHAAGTARVVCAEPGCGAPVPQGEDGRRAWSTPRELFKLEQALHHADRRRAARERKARQRARARAA